MQQKYFRECIKLAEKAAKRGEVPIGAIIVNDNRILSKGYNLREKKHNIIAHAEVLVIQKAAKKLKRWNLSDCTLYVTLKPCTMCENIINQSRIKKVYYLCDKLDYKKEYKKTTYQHYCNENLQIYYQKQLSQFFSHKR